MIIARVYGVESLHLLAEIIEVMASSSARDTQDATEPKQKSGVRIKGAIIRNLQHDRKLKQECDALQKAKRRIENDMKNIMHEKQRHSIVQAHLGLRGMNDGYWGRVGHRGLTHTNSTPQLRRMSCLSRALTESATSSNGFCVHANEQSKPNKTVSLLNVGKDELAPGTSYPYYEQRFLKMLENSQRVTNPISNGSGTVETALPETDCDKNVSNEVSIRNHQSNIRPPVDEGTKPRNSDLRLDGDKTCSICDGEVIDKVEVPIEKRLHAANNGQQVYGAVDYSWNLTRLDQAAKNRCNSVDNHCHVENGRPRTTDIGIQKASGDAKLTLSREKAQRETRRVSLAVLGTFTGKSRTFSMSNMAGLRSSALFNSCRFGLDDIDDDCETHCSGESTPKTSKRGDLFYQDGCFITEVRRRPSNNGTT